MEPSGLPSGTVLLLQPLDDALNDKEQFFTAAGSSSLDGGQQDAAAVSALALLPLSLQEAAQDAAAWFEVVLAKEPYIGLRSWWAGGKFLQARRRSPCTAFFSTHLGVWEQWEAEITPLPTEPKQQGDRVSQQHDGGVTQQQELGLGDDSSQEHSRGDYGCAHVQWALRLTNRQLPAIQLLVHAHLQPSVLTGLSPNPSPPSPPFPPALTPQQLLSKQAMLNPSASRRATPSTVLVPLPSFECGLTEECSTMEALGNKDELIPTAVPRQPASDHSTPSTPHTTADPGPIHNVASELGSPVQQPWRPAATSSQGGQVWTEEQAVQRCATDSGAVMGGGATELAEHATPVERSAGWRLSGRGLLPSGTPTTTRRRWSTAEGMTQGNGTRSMAGSILATRPRTSTLTGASTSSFADTAQLWSGPHTSFMDDALYLSHRVVKGWVARVGRAMLYITFKLWRAQARRSAALLMKADEHNRAHKLQAGLRAWSAHTQRAQQLRVASLHISRRWVLKLAQLVLMAWQDVVQDLQQQQAMQQQEQEQTTAEVHLQQQVRDSQEEQCRLQQKLDQATGEQSRLQEKLDQVTEELTVITDRWEEAVQQQAGWAERIQQLTQTHDSSKQQVVDLEQQLRAAQQGFKEAAEQLQVAEGQLLCVQKELEEVQASGQQQQLAAEQQLQEVLSQQANTERQLQHSEQELVATQQLLELSRQEQTKLQQQLQVTEQDQHTHEQQLQDTAAQQLVTAAKAVQLQLLWRAWSAVCFTSRDREQWAVNWWTHQLLHAAWSTWQQQVHASIARQHAAGRLQQQWRQRQTQSALLAWHTVVASLQAGRERACFCARKRAQRRTAWLVLRAWQRLCSAYGDKLQAAALTAQFRVLQRSLGAWHQWAHRKALRCMAGTELASVVLTRMVARTFFAWRQSIREGVRRKQIGMQIQRQHQKLVLLQAFKAWVDSTLVQNQHVQQVAVFAVRRQEQLVQRAFYHWAVCTSIIKAATKLAHNHQQRHMKRVLHGWLGLTEARRHRAWLVQQHQALSSSRLKYRAWQAWQDVTWSPWPLQWTQAAHQAYGHSRHGSLRVRTSLTQAGQLPRVPSMPAIAAPPSSPPATSYAAYSPRGHGVAFNNAQSWFAGSRTAPTSPPHSPRPASPTAWQMMARPAGYPLSQHGGVSGAAEFIFNHIGLIPGLMPLYRLRAKQVLHAWHHVCQRCRYFQYVTKHLQHRKARGLLGHSLYTLQRHAQHMVTARKRAAVMADAHQHRLVNAAMQGWMQVTQVGRQVRVLCDRLGRVRRHNMLVRCLICWQAAVAQHAAGRQQLHSIAAARRHRLMRECLRLWAAAVARAAQLVHTAEKMSAARIVHCQRTVLLHWHQIASSHSEQTAALLRHAAAVRRQRICRAVLTGWHHAAHNALQEREDFPWMCRVFYSWLALAQNPDSVPSPPPHARPYSASHFHQGRAVPLQLMGTSANSVHNASAAPGAGPSMSPGPTAAPHVHVLWDEKGAVTSPIGQPRFQARTSAEPVTMQASSTAAAVGAIQAQYLQQQQQSHSVAPRAGTGSQLSAHDVTAAEQHPFLYSTRPTMPLEPPVRSVTPTKSHVAGLQQGWPGAERVQRQLQHARELTRSVEQGLCTRPSQLSSRTSQPVQPDVVYDDSRDAGHASGTGLAARPHGSAPVAGSAYEGNMQHSRTLASQQVVVVAQGPSGLDSMVEQLRQQSLSALGRRTPDPMKTDLVQPGMPPHTAGIVQPAVPVTMRGQQAVAVTQHEHNYSSEGGLVQSDLASAGLNACLAPSLAGASGITAPTAPTARAPAAAMPAASQATAAAAVLPAVPHTAGAAAVPQAAAAAPSATAHSQQSTDQQQGQTAPTALGAGLPAGSVMVVMVPPHTASHTIIATGAGMATAHTVTSKSVLVGAPHANGMHTSAPATLLLGPPSPTPSSRQSPPVQQLLQQPPQQQQLAHQQVLLATTSDAGAAHADGGLQADVAVEYTHNSAGSVPSLHGYAHTTQLTVPDYAHTSQQPVCRSVSPNQDAAELPQGDMLADQRQGWTAADVQMEQQLLLQQVQFLRQQQQQQQQREMHFLQQHMEERHVPAAGQAVPAACTSAHARAAAAAAALPPSGSSQSLDTLANASLFKHRAASTGNGEGTYMNGLGVSSSLGQAARAVTRLHPQHMHLQQAPRQHSATGAEMQSRLRHTASQASLLRAEASEDSIQGLRARRDFILDQLRSVGHTQADNSAVYQQQRQQQPAFQQQQQQQETVACTELSDYLSLLGVLPLSSNNSHISSNHTSAPGATAAAQATATARPQQVLDSQQWQRRSSHDENEGSLRPAVTLQNHSSSANRVTSHSCSGSANGAGWRMSEDRSAEKLGLGSITGRPVPVRSLLSSITNTFPASHAYSSSTHADHHSMDTAHHLQAARLLRGQPQQAPHALQHHDAAGLPHHQALQYQNAGRAPPTQDMLLNSYQRLLNSSMALEETLAASLDSPVDIAPASHMSLTASHTSLDVLARARLPAWQRELVLSKDPASATAGRAVLEQLRDEGHELHARLAVHALVANQQHQRYQH